MSRVAITQDLDDIGRAIAAALGHLPLEQLVAGRFVAVKPNETWPTADDTSAVTQGDTLRAVLREVKRCAPRELVVTGGAGARRNGGRFPILGDARRHPRRGRRAGGP